jgi:hypothetical protein
LTFWPAALAKIQSLAVRLGIFRPRLAALGISMTGSAVVVLAALSSLQEKQEDLARLVLQSKDLTVLLVHHGRPVTAKAQISIVTTYAFRTTADAVAVVLAALAVTNMAALA